MTRAAAATGSRKSATVMNRLRCDIGVISPTPCTGGLRGASKFSSGPRTTNRLQPVTLTHCLHAARTGASRHTDRRSRHLGSPEDGEGCDPADLLPDRCHSVGGSGILLCVEGNLSDRKYRHL